MKRLIALTIMVSLSQQATAKDEINCNSIYKLSASIMTARQMNLSIADVIGDGSVALTTEIAIDAYSKQLFSSDKYKQIAIDSFANKYALACYKMK